MAKEIASLPEWKQGETEDFVVYMNRMDNVLCKIQEEGNLLSFPYADGYACYELVSKKPLTVRHIPAGDAWHVHPSMIRGLRLSDIR